MKFDKTVTREAKRWRVNLEDTASSNEPKCKGVYLGYWVMILLCGGNNNDGDNHSTNASPRAVHVMHVMWSFLVLLQLKGSAFAQKNPEVT